MTSSIGSRRAAVAAALASLTSSAALANPFPPDAVMFRLHAKSSIGTGVFEAQFRQGTYNAVQQRFVWELASPVTIFDTVFGLPMARLISASVEMIEDPQVNVAFNVQAGNAITEFAISTALLAFPTIDAPQGRTSAGLSVTDTGSDGASISGLASGGNSYLAQYNGFVPTGTTFAALLQSVVAGAGESNAAAASVPGGGAYTPIGTRASDMSAMFHFNLTTDDLASGTSHWEIIPVPGPSALALVGLGLAAMGRKRRA
jgi:uncharacterized protein (TIGR03382 family)